MRQLEFKLTGGASPGLQGLIKDISGIHISDMSIYQVNNLIKYKIIINKPNETIYILNKYNTSRRLS